MPKLQRIRDPLHDLIEFKPNEFEQTMWGVIQTAPFQRLRRIKQLGFSELVFPGATHTRFAHSLGVFHTARILMQIIHDHMEKTRSGSFSPTRRNTALAAALVHDIGHGPFSHAFEHVGKKLGLPMARHEAVSDQLIRDSEISEKLKELGSGFHNDVANLVKRDGPRDLYDAVVSSQFDADRLDYMRRDRLMTGAQSGAIDFQWLLANIDVGSVPIQVDEEFAGERETFVMGPKAELAAEAYVLGLFQLYPTIYFHKATRGAEKIFSALVERFVKFVREESTAKTGVPENHPLVKFARSPEKLDTVLALDDFVVWGALSMMEEAEDVRIAEFASRLKNRDMLKCVDIRQEIVHAMFPGKPASAFLDSEVEKQIEGCVAKADQKISEWNTRNSRDGDGLRVLLDYQERDPYKRFQETKGPLNQIMIKTPDGQIVDMAERSAVVSSLRPYKLYRAYMDKDDKDAAEAIRQIAIQEADQGGE